MSLDKNYSTINKQTKVFNIDDTNYNTSRVIVNIPQLTYEDGITGGDVIRYDTVGGIYIKSIANQPQNSEVFGIVESVSSDFSLNVVINGSITLNNNLINRSGLNSGENDIYFLSGVSAGFVENAGPTFPNYIIKPIYQVAPHGNYTGLVRNYLGYSNGVLTPNNEVPANAPDIFKTISFSDNMTKILLFNGFTREFSFRVSTFSLANLQFNTQEEYKIKLEDIVIPAGLDIVDFANNQNYDAKISNDGLSILIFEKHKNKIYYLEINLFTGTLDLKQIIYLSLNGSPEDKLWAVDDELVSMTVSTKALTRNPSVFDSKITSHEVSSRIQYFKRTIDYSQLDSKRWKRVHENHAFGFCDASPREMQGSCVDSYALTSGVYRTSDIKCKGKNFSLSTMCLIQDQIDYKSKITGYFSPRYNGIQKDKPIQVTKISSIDGDAVTLTTITAKTTFFGDGVNSTSVLQNNPNRDTPQFRSYKCGFGFKNYRIAIKSGSYYYEDYSYRDPSGIMYFKAGDNAAIFDFPQYDRQYLNSFQLSQSTILDAPQTSIEASITKTCCTANNIFCCFRYGTEIGVFKFPFLSSDGLSPFRYFERSRTALATVPSTTGFGLIYNNLTSPIVNFDFFATDSVFFICTSNKTYINGTIEISTVNFDKAKFYSTATNIFFYVDDKIFRFNSPTNSFEEVIVRLTQ